MEWVEEIADDTIYDNDGNIQRHKQFAKVGYVPSGFPRQQSRVGQQRDMNKDISEGTKEFDTLTSTQSKSKTQNSRSYGSAPAMQAGRPNQQLTILKVPKMGFKQSQGNDPRLRSGMTMEDTKS